MTTERSSEKPNGAQMRPVRRNRSIVYIQGTDEPIAQCTSDVWAARVVQAMNFRLASELMKEREDA